MIISDGELYRMQNDAIKEARDTAKLSTGGNKEKEKKDGAPINTDKLILLAILFVLIADNCSDNTLLIVLAILAIT